MNAILNEIKTAFYNDVSQAEPTLNLQRLQTKEIDSAIQTIFQKKSMRDENLVRYTVIQGNRDRVFNAVLADSSDRLKDIEVAAELTWLCLPGGPGADSSYLEELIKGINIPGDVVLLDLPGNGSNLEGIPSDYNYECWSSCFLNAIAKFKKPILIGHSFGAMFPLLFEEVENHVKGLVLLNGTPNYSFQKLEKYGKAHNLPNAAKAMVEFAKSPENINPTELMGACLPYYFPKYELELGGAWLSQFVYTFPPTIWWTKKIEQSGFEALAVPNKIPVTVVGGIDDHMCDFKQYERDSRFNKTNIALNLLNVGHFGWSDSENMPLFQRVFTDFYERLQV